MLPMTVPPIQLDSADRGRRPQCPVCVSFVVYARPAICDSICNAVHGGAAASSAAVGNAVAGIATDGNTADSIADGNTTS